MTFLECWAVIVLFPTEFVIHSLLTHMSHWLMERKYNFIMNVHLLPQVDDMHLCITVIFESQYQI